jgi:hypothetical protein
MTTPEEPAMGIRLDTYLSLGFATRDPDQGIKIPTSHKPVGGPLHKRVTVPWDTDFSDPENQHSGGGWTILYGPCHYDLVAVLRLWYGTPGASGHLGFWHASVIDGVDTRVATQEVCEWSVDPHETSNTHVGPMNWKGWLPAGQRLRVELDYWNGPEDVPIRIIGGQVRGWYGRPIEEEPTA